MEIKEFKNFVLVFISIAILKFLFTYNPTSKNKTINETKKEVISEVIKETKKEVIKHKKNNFINVTATMYYPTINQCDNDPLITAANMVINPKEATNHKWIAISRDLLKIFKYGDKVKIVGTNGKDGIYTIADTMNKRFKNKIDILETEGTPIYKFNNVKIYKV